MRTRRARWIALVCSLGAISLGVVVGPGAVRFFRERSAIADLRSKDPEERRAALRSLAALASRGAVHGILGSMEMPEIPPMLIPETPREGWPSAPLWDWDYAEAMEAIGVRAVAPLTEKLSSTKAAERFWALRFLGRLPELRSEESTQALPYLLDDPDPRVHAEAVLVLGASAATSPLHFERLVGDLKAKESSDRVRAGAARALCIAARDAGYGSSAELLVRSAALALGEALADASPAVRLESTRGLCAVPSSAPDLERSIHRLLATRLADPDSEIRRIASEHLAEAAAIPVLIEVLEKGVPGDRPGALEVLRAIDGDPVWLAAIELLARADGALCDVLERLLSSLGEKERIGADRLVEGLSSPHPEVRRSAVKVLVRLYASHFNGGLLALLEHRDGVVRLQAVKALAWSVNITTDALEASVLDLLANGRTDLLRESACKAAPSLGPGAVKAVPLLASLVEAEPWKGRSSAAEALGEIGPMARTAVPTLAAAVDRRDPDLAVAAMRALLRISPAEGVGACTLGLRHESELVRDAAVSALWALEADASPALEALRKMRENETSSDLAERVARLIAELEAEPALHSR